MRILCLLLCALLAFASSSAQQTYFPSTVQWKNIKTDYGAVGDGVTDDTEAFKRAVTTYMNPYNSAITVFIPNGTYLLSDSIRFLQGYYDCCLTLQGESQAGTIIKLKDNAANFQDIANPRPLFYTRAGNQAFGNYFFNLSINTGISNEGAVGIDYITSNYGAVRNVNISSPDGSGYCGIQMERTWPGPGIIKNVNVDGFQYGIRMATCEYSMTFEDVVLSNQTIAGIYTNCNTMAIRKLTTNNLPKAIVGQGLRLTIDNSQLNGNNSLNYAITNTGGFVYARNINSTGFAGALNNNGTLINTASITELQTGVNYSLFTNNGKSLGLPVEETPEYINNNPADWANATTYGALTTNPFYSIVDATAGVQAALNSGKKAIFFSNYGDNNTSYCIYSDIVIPPTVELITGFNCGKFSFFNGSKFVVNSNGTSPLFIERTKGLQIQNNSMRTVVLKHITGSDYTNTVNNSNGKVFLEDWVDRFTPAFPVQMWARHLNGEVQPENDFDITNNGGKMWILGLKTEGRAIISKTTNGGSTEILGGLVYPSSSFSGNAQPAFVAEDANTSIAGITMTSYVGNGWYGLGFSEKQGATTQNLLASTIWGTTPYNFTFYRTQNTAVLPIKWLSTTVNSNDCKTAIIIWKISNEVNSKQFEVEHSIDGISFMQIATLPSKATNANVQTYSVAHQLSSTNKNYYRIKQIDLSGIYEYSKVVAIECKNVNNWVRFSPNPFSNVIDVNISASIGNYVNFRMLDVAGKVVYENKLEAGYHAIEAEKFSAGVYFVQYRLTSGEWQTQKLVKQ